MFLLPNNRKKCISSQLKRKRHLQHLQKHSIMAPLKRLPYGVSDFKQLRNEGKYLVDKTKYIQKMEYTDNFLFLIRPRRFGKSVFLSMLRSYYDINERDNFQELFKGLWIADHPTEWRGQFQMMYFDYSRIGGDTGVLEENFEIYCCKVMDDFAKRYKNYYDEDFIRDLVAQTNFRAKINMLDMEARRLDYPLYLVIDEYDNFTNTVLNKEGEAVYHALTHALQLLRFVRETCPEFNDEGLNRYLEDAALLGYVEGRYDWDVTREYIKTEEQKWLRKSKKFTLYGDDPFRIK